MIAAGVFVAGTLTLAANGASGIAPGTSSAVPDAAFQPVVLPSNAPRLEPPGALDRPQVLAPGPPATPDLRPFVVALPSSEPVERPQPKVPDSNPIVARWT
ncbi:MAG: hypothetical protein FIA92_01815, partial [Chloroflexi bacterium]|nr:hypothetical protein [Chloroflexota bacterium]